MSRARQLRRLLQQHDIVVAPGAYDAISARAIAQAGFEAVYMTGSGTAAARGFPDFGLLTMTEMADNAGIIARSVELPVISDADTGYGSELNITRTVREFESRQVAAIHIEDQVDPKRCGHLEDKAVVSTEDFLVRIRAALHARRDPDFMIIARTDARAVHGLDDAIDRVNAALGAGADMAFVEAPQTLAELEEVPARVRGPCLLNLVVGGKSPVFSVDEAAQMGYRMMIVPGALFRAAMARFDEVLAELRDTGRPPPQAATVKEGFQRFDADAWAALRSKFKS